MRNFVVIFIWCIFNLLFISPSYSEVIHFADNTYNFYSVGDCVVDNCVENLYYKNNENKDIWKSRFRVYYYADISSPLKYAQQITKDIESSENRLLLKFVQNKKQNIAIISYLETVENNGKSFFVYNVLKYAKNSKQGLDVLRYEQRYNFVDKDSILKMTSELRNINDDYIERMIIASIPEIVNDN